MAASPPVFHRATITRIVRETADARTFVLDTHEGPFSYQAGQFCTFRVPVNGTPLLRSYSMSSAPETDGELITTVKRVPGGAVSNWLIDHVDEGDEVELTVPRGRFCLRAAEVPVLGFCGGSGITPILSLAKSALATTDRRVRLLCADRNQESAIFVAALNDLLERHPDRLSVVRHLDDERGLLDATTIREFVGSDAEADFYLCGPDPFMELVESTLPEPGRIFTERFDATPTTSPTDTPEPAEEAPGQEVEGTVTIVLGKDRVSVPRQPNETLLESARRAGLSPPFSCESGNCATCMGKLTEGNVTMRANNALFDDEIAEGLVLTCQSVPDTPSVTVHYE